MPRPTAPRTPRPRHVRVGRKSSRRFPELDGLRGIAALIVLGHHVLLVVPAAAAAYVGGTLPDRGSAIWFLTNTPLRLVVAGPEAVLVFFVLSGLVVALPVLRSNHYGWVNYYTSRTIRLGIPVVAAVLLATLLRLVTPVPDHPSGWIQMAQVPDMSWTYVWRAIDLISGDYVINNPLWSLRWEMIFSLALPIYVAIAVFTGSRRAKALLLGGTIAVVWAAGVAGNMTFVYLPVFLLGSAAAFRIVRARRLETSTGPVAGLGWLGVLVGSCLVLILPWLVTAPIPIELTALLKAFPALGALGVVWTALRWDGLRRLLSSTPFQLAGRYSFSLYLVHVPVIYLVIGLLPDQPFRVLAPTIIGASIALAIGFYYAVEKPGHRLARHVGTRATAKLTAFTTRPHTTQIRIPDQLRPLTGMIPKLYAGDAPSSTSRASDSKRTGTPSRTG